MVSPFATVPALDWAFRRGAGDVPLELLALLFGLGLAGIAILPVRRPVRAVTAIVYLPVAVVAVFLWLLVFVCSLYGACL